MSTNPNSVSADNNMDAFVTTMLERFDDDDDDGTSKTGCKRSACKIRLCDKVLVQEAVEAHSFLTLEQRCSQALRKLKSILQSPTPDSAYAARHAACKIGSQRVCDACFAAYYCVTLRMMTRLKADARAGKSVHGNGPRQFRGNKFRTPKSMTDATEKLHEYFNIHVKTNDDSITTRNNSTTEANATKFVLPPSFTNELFYKAYCDYCSEVLVESPVNINKFISIWKTDHGEIVLAAAAADANKTKKTAGTRRRLSPLSKTDQ